MRTPYSLVSIIPTSYKFFQNTGLLFESRGEGFRSLPTSSQVPAIGTVLFFLITEKGFFVNAQGHHAHFLIPIPLGMKFLEEPSHILPEGLHGLDPFGILLNISRVPADTDVPVT